MRYFIPCIFLVAVTFSSCEIKIKTGSGDESKIRNGITIRSNNIQVEQAFLLFEDGSLVPEDNKIEVNQKIKLRLIASGWKENEGRVFLNASEKLETSEGDVFLDEKDMFKDYEEGITAEDAKIISLSVVITGINKLYDYFKVSFRVEDKTDPARFTEGDYKLYLK